MPFSAFRTVIIPQPISARGLSGLLSSRENDMVRQVKALGMITVMIWKGACMYLYVIECCYLNSIQAIFMMRTCLQIKICLPKR